MPKPTRLVGRAPSAARRRTHHPFILAALLMAGAGAGCSGTPSLPTLGIPTPEPEATARADAGVPSPAAALQAGLLPEDLVTGTPTENYTRVARGALTCWFGAAGPLKAAYIYHAEAEPASKGGASEIKIMTRDTAADDPRALRAYRIVFAPSENKTRIEIENVRIPEPLATRMRLDVKRWSGDDEPGCEGPVTAGWSAEQVVETKPAAKADKKKKP